MRTSSSKCRQEPIVVEVVCEPESIDIRWKSEIEQQSFEILGKCVEVVVSNGLRHLKYELMHPKTLVQSVEPS